MPTDRRVPAVVVDEAYAEFTGRSVIGLRERFPNVVAVRTASKAYALAGLRVGFAVGHRATIHRVALYRPPGLDQHGLGDGRRGGDARAVGDARERRPRAARAPAARRGARGRGLEPAAVGDELPAARPRARPERAEAASLALMRRGPRAADVRARPPARPLPAGHRPRPRARTTGSSRPSRPSRPPSPRSPDEAPA